MPRDRKSIFKVKQWMPTWSHASWDSANGKPKPPDSFYVGSMPLALLRSLSGINPRTKEARKLRAKDAGYQRAHEKDRSTKIGRYLQFGYPLSSAASLDATQHAELINPGWLPTAILVNVLQSNSERLRGTKKFSVKKGHLVEIAKVSGGFAIDFPTDIAIDEDKDLPPLEIIDGQHRLLAADLVEELPDNYEVPVVLFDGLPLVWQAYLFWVINVEPKKINPSLAFDLYPELRNQDWLERGESIKVYQEHRAQELTEVLWKHPESPWHERIELFGKRIDGHVSNAAAIRSLAATFVRKWGKATEEDNLTRIGGLFGSVDKFGKSYVLPWKRSQQAALLIRVWQAVRSGVKATKAEWAKDLRTLNLKTDLAFLGAHSLLATDQGFRSISFAYNSMCQVVFEKLDLADWFTKVDSEPTDESVSRCLKELESKNAIVKYLDAIGVTLADELDWRTSSAPGLNEREQVDQGQYRGSSGYAALNRATIGALKKSKNATVSKAAQAVIELTGWTHG